MADLCYGGPLRWRATPASTTRDRDAAYLLHCESSTSFRRGRTECLWGASGKFGGNCPPCPDLEPPLGPGRLTTCISSICPLGEIDTDSGYTFRIAWIFVCYVVQTTFCLHCPRFWDDAFAF